MLLRDGSEFKYRVSGTTMDTTVSTPKVGSSGRILPSADTYHFIVTNCELRPVQEVLKST
jgi:hypothetical protein